MLNVNCIYCKTILLQLKECIICMQSWSWSMLWFNVQISSICWNWFNFFETDFIF